MDQKNVTALILIDLPWNYFKKIGRYWSITCSQPFNGFAATSLVDHSMSKSAQVSPHLKPSLLFSIYTNDLPSATKARFFGSYVDDGKVLLSFPMNNKLEAKAKLEEDLIRVTSWCCANSLLINADKTTAIKHLHWRRFFELPWQNVISAKDLGVILDAHLKFDEHISKSESSCMSKLCQINRIRHI